MKDIKTWQERMGKSGPPIACMQAEIAELRAALAARATPAQPVQTSINIVPDVACKQGKCAMTTTGCRDRCSLHGVPYVVAAKAQLSPSTVAEAIRALPLPGLCVTDGVYGFTIQQFRAFQAEAAALAEKAQGQQWLPIENAPKDQRVLLWFPIFGNESHVEFGEWDAQQHNKKPNPYWSGDMERVFGVNWYREYPPTHYMLPPAAPSIAQDGQKSEDGHGA
jgi:hypothetical protein